MRSRYKKILLSTCIPAIALSTIAYSPVSHAGFEWTPPEQNNVVPEYVEDSIIEDYLIEETEIDVITEPVEAEIEDDVLQAIEIKVLDSSLLENDPAPEIKYAPEETVVIKTIEPIEEKEVIILEAEPEFEIEKQEKAPIIMYEPEEKAKPDAKKPLILNPYPIAQKEEAKAEETVEIMVSMPEAESPAPIIIEKEAKKAISWNPPQSFDVIEGFGKAMPLALALRQIVPPQYAFSFNNGINPGTLISWEGGKPWNEVLTSALAPLLIKADIKAKKVVLSTTKTSESSSPAKKKLNFQKK